MNRLWPVSVVAFCSLVLYAAGRVGRGALWLARTLARSLAMKRLLPLVLVAVLGLGAGYALRAQTPPPAVDLNAKVTVTMEMLLDLIQLTYGGDIRFDAQTGVVSRHIRDIAKDAAASAARQGATPERTQFFLESAHQRKAVLENLEGGKLLPFFRKHISPNTTFAMVWE